MLSNRAMLKKNKEAPINNVKWVPLEKVKANNYNPNAVASIEMELLYISIKEDQYTQPIVTYYNENKDEYEIVDGFHRYLIMKRHKDIYDYYNGLLPVVVIKKDINERMASTIRHNRARGKHSVVGMAEIVFALLKNGKTKEEICKSLGMEYDEFDRIKVLTGYSKLYEKEEYSKAWEYYKHRLVSKKGKGNDKS